MELTYSSIEGRSKSYYIALAALAVITVAGFACFIASYVSGHQLFGSSNVVPWGLPIVLAIYLIGLSAGALILSSLTYVFGREEYRVIARMAVFLAIVLIFGAMVAIALDLGRPEKVWRLFMFFFQNNMISMFAINSILYGGYFVISIAYLGVIFAGNKVLTRKVGIVAVFWAVLVHMGTGAIFGFIAAREVFASPIKPFEFLAAALVSGLALLIIAVFFSMKLSKRSLNKQIITSLGRLLLVVTAILLVLVLVDKLTHFYSPDRAAVVYLLTGHYSPLFWAQAGLGYLLPIGLLLHPRTGRTVGGVIVASASAVVGIFFERYALVIPGAAYPLQYYPGDIAGVWGEVGSFPLMPVEVVMSLGLVASLGLLYLLGLRFLDLLPPKQELGQVGKLEAEAS